MSWPFVRNVILRDVVESTNDLARELALEGDLELPLAIRAAQQTRGRGRGAHAWWSDAGSLTCSILLDPSAHGLRVEHEPRLALALAVGVIDAMADYLPPGVAGIRWPNDVEVEGQKLGGILPERVETARGPRVVIGLGLNVLTRMGDAPPEVRRMATSLAERSIVPLAPDAVELVFRAILEHFELVLGRLAQDDPGLAARWDQLDTLRNRRVRVDLGPRVVAGLGRGIDPEGALVLSVGCEEVRIFGGQVLRDG